MRTFETNPAKLKRRKLNDQLFRSLCIVSASTVVVILIVLIGTILNSASSSLTFQSSLPRLVNDTGASKYDGVTRENKPVFSILQGTGPAGSTAIIYARNSNGEEIKLGSSSPRNDGSFEVPSIQLEDGPYEVWFVIEAEDSTEVETSRSINIVIDTVPPEGIVFDESTLGDRVVNAEEFEDFVVGGEGVEEDARVEVNFSDGQGNQLGPVPARIKKDGYWRIPQTSLARLQAGSASKTQVGNLIVSAKHFDLAGNQQEPVKLSIKFDLQNQSEPDQTLAFADDSLDLTPKEIEVIRPTNFKTFLTSYHYDNAPEVSGIFRALVGSMLLAGVCALFTIPIGIGSAIFLEEFKPKNKIFRAFHGFIQLNISNLAGVPSIVYGILGVTAFVYMFSLFPPRTVDTRPGIEFGTNYYYQLETLGGQYVKIPCRDKQKTTIEINEPMEAIGDDGKFTLEVVDSSLGLSEEERLVSVKRGKTASIVDSEHHWYYISLPFGKSFLAAGLTLGLVVLPIIIIASQEAIRAVPDSLREASMGMGATQWQTVNSVVLPAATPGIMTGTILALSRAIGEAAPILAVMGGVLSVIPKNLMESTSALPILIYKWAKDASRGFHSLSAAAIVVLLLLLLAMNSVAIVIRYRAERKNK